MVAASSPPITSGLTLSLKLFLPNVAPLKSYCPSAWTPGHGNGLLIHGYDTWHYYLIQISVPHNNYFIYLIFCYKICFCILIYFAFGKNVKKKLICVIY